MPVLDLGFPLVLGTFWFDAAAPDEVDVAIGTFIDGGGRVLDTARVYGTSEDAIGAWLRGAGCDAAIQIVSKGAHHDLADGRPRLGAADVLSDARASVELLGRAPDIHLLHRDEPARAVDDVADALVAVLDEGLAAAVGVSNWSTERTEALHAALVARGHGVAAISDAFGLARPRASEDGSRHLTRPSLRWAVEHGVPELAWSSQSGGFFAGRDRPQYDDAENRRRREVLRRVATEAGVRPEAVLARWTATASDAIVPVATSRSPERLAHLVADVRDASLDPVVTDLIAAIDPSGALGRILLAPGD